MGMSISQGVTITTEDLSKNELNFGFQEPMATGDLDTVNTWTEALGGTAQRTAYRGNIRLQTGANAASTVDLSLNRQFFTRISEIGAANSEFSKFNIEFTFNVISWAGLDDAHCFIGMAQSPGSDRTTNDICGIFFNSSAVYLLNDVGGVETTQLCDGLAAATYHKLKIVYENLQISLYRNGVLSDTLTDTAFSNVAFFQMFIQNDAASNVDVRIANLRMWFDE